MLYYFKKSKNAIGTQKKICTMYGEGVVTHKKCQKWFVKFRTRDFSPGNAPWSCRPIEVDGVQIETLRTLNVVMPTGNSQRTQNIQINKVTVKNEKCVFF